MMYDAIVLGSGAGGMAAGLTLARQGNSVLVLEAGKAFGGMMNPFARKKFSFDVGLHYIGECGQGQLLRGVFDSLGLEDLRFNEISPAAIDRYVFPDAEGVLCKGIDAWCEQLLASFPLEKENLRRFARLLHAADATTRAAWKGPRLRDVKDIAMGAWPLAVSARSTMKELLDYSFSDPNLKNLVSGPCGDVGVPPGRMSALVGISLLVHFLGGAYYPRGGTRAWRDAFVEGMKDHGAELLRNKEAVRIQVAGPRDFTVTTASGQAYRSRAIVSDIDADSTLAMLEGAHPNGFTRRRMSRLRPSLGTVCVFLGVDLDLRKSLTDANIWHYPTNNLDQLFDDVAGGALQDEPFFFLTSPTIKDPDGHKAPQGFHTLELITGAAARPFQPWFGKKTLRRGRDYEQLKNDFADRMIESVERHYVPNLRKHIVIREVSTPATNVSYVRTPAGGIYGPEFSKDQSFLKRFLPWVGIPGLYLAGASTFGPGVMTCTLSGVAAGRMAALELKLRGRTLVQVPRESFSKLRSAAPKAA